MCEDSFRLGSQKWIGTPHSGSFRRKGLERFFCRGDHRGIATQSANPMRRLLDGSPQ
jgi:plasmid maintenance system killer protein